MSLNLHCGSCGKSVAIQESNDGKCPELTDCPICGKDVIKDNQALMRDTDKDEVFTIRVEKKKPIKTAKSKKSGK